MFTADKKFNQEDAKEKSALINNNNLKKKNKGASLLLLLSVANKNNCYENYVNPA